MEVRVQLSVPGSYLPPVFVAMNVSSTPLQTNISSPVHTTAWAIRPSGTPVSPVGVQLSVLGLYLPPVRKGFMLSLPPQTIISLPVHSAVCTNRGVTTVGAVAAKYRSSYVSPPLFNSQLPPQLLPPQASSRCRSTLRYDNFARQAR